VKTLPVCGYHDEKNNQLSRFVFANNCTKCKLWVVTYEAKVRMVSLCLPCFFVVKGTFYTPSKRKELERRELARPTKESKAPEV
jgi:hypothetical protein